MLKKVISLLLCAALLFHFSLEINAFAEGAAPEIVSAYRTKDTLYAFLRFDKDDPGKFKASTAELGGTSVDPVSVNNVGVQISYVFLMDMSISMEDHLNEAKDFVTALVSNKRWNSRAILIPYNTRIHEDKLTDTAAPASGEPANAMAKAIDALELVNSDNMSGVCAAEALDYLSAHYPTGEGGLVNLILITDDLNDMTGAGFQRAKDKLGASPEILFHTVLLGRNSGVGKRFGNKGLNLFVNEKKSAETAAESLLDYIGGLYRIALPWESAEEQSGRTAAEWFLQFRSEGDVIPVQAENVALMLAQDGRMELYAAGQAAAEDGEQGSPAQTEQPQQTIPESEPGAEEAVQEKEKGTGTDNPQETVPGMDGPEGDTPDEGEAPAETAEASDDTPEDEAEKTVPDKLSLAAIISGAVILALAAAAVAVLIARKRQKNMAGSAIQMRLEVLSGRYKGKQKDFALVEELLIGRDKRCDIVFLDEAVSDVNSRVFIKDGFIYIEDLNSARGTAIEGMNIYSPNRLKSGYEVSIGNVRFRFYF